MGGAGLAPSPDPYLNKGGGFAFRIPLGPGETGKCLLFIRMFAGTDDSVIIHFGVSAAKS